MDDYILVVSSCFHTVVFDNCRIASVPVSCSDDTGCLTRRSQLQIHLDTRTVIDRHQAGLGFAPSGVIIQTSEFIPCQLWEHQHIAARHNSAACFLWIWPYRAIIFGNPTPAMFEAAHTLCEKHQVRELQFSRFNGEI